MGGRASFRRYLGTLLLSCTFILFLWSLRGAAGRVVVPFFSKGVDRDYGARDLSWGGIDVCCLSFS